MVSLFWLFVYEWSGHRTSTSWVVNFTPQPGTKPGDLVQVRIIRPANVTLVGEEIANA